MTRKRIKHEQVSDEGRRNAIFEKRANGLLKNANDLSILCGVEIGIVIHRQGGPNNEILWPSPEIFGERLEKFMAFPKSERQKKMVPHDRYMEHIINSEGQDVSKMEKRVAMKESNQVLNEIVQGKALEELDLYQLNGMNSYFDDMLEKIGKKENQFNQEGTSLAVPQGAETSFAVAQEVGTSFTVPQGAGTSFSVPQEVRTSFTVPQGTGPSSTVPYEIRRRIVRRGRRGRPSSGAQSGAMDISSPDHDYLI